MVKEKTVFLHDLPALKCNFSWDTDTLQARIKAYKPDYNPKDPWTWPQLRSSQHPGYRENRPDPVALSQGIAYLPRELGQVVSIRHSWGNTGWIRHDNLLFPFSIDGDGHSSDADVLAARDRWNWIHKVTGTPPDLLEVEMEERPERPESTTEAFQQVLKMMNEEPKKDNAEVESLRREAGRLKTLLASEKARADKAEKDMAAMTKSHAEQCDEMKSSIETVINEYEEQLAKQRSQISVFQAQMKDSHEKLQRKTVDHEKGVKREARWAEEVKQLVKESKEKDQRLEVAQKEAATAKEQVMKIWAEMKKSKEAEVEAESRKRDACSDAPGSGGKKAKIEN